ncbi:ABC transporter permease [Sphingobium cloacae]|uniref:Binding-protein-dependent transport system innermembrane protein n=1 Tax=Sphingobium cloacae TaxID=120107 RepID=A0A1E1F0U6_9SPHN|nr:ABC transporter permease [Sphingobium cloacae]BAV64127.1 binding-protein-dependent transport system innermembrane protein [Sphingobium cloacae]
MSVLIVQTATVASTTDETEETPASARAVRQPIALETVSLPDARRGRGWAPSWLLRIAGPVVLLIAWQAVTTLHLVDTRSLASPLAVAQAADALWTSGDLQLHFLASLQRVAWGLALGVGIGLMLALFAGLSRAGEHLVDSSMNMVRMVPVIALLPLIIVWMGIGEPAKIALIVIGVTFPVYMNSFAAIRGVDQKLVEAGQAFGLNRWGLVCRVILPGAVPGFLVGLRWALGAAWLLLFFSEQINADRGLGYLINQAQSWNRTDYIVLGLVIYGLLGFVGDQGIRLIERTVLSWRKGFNGV